MRFRRAIAALAVAAGAASAVWGFWIEPASIRLTDYELPLQRWPARLDGLRVAVITDLHAGAPYVDLAKIERLVVLVNDTQPDLVLIAGDIYENSVLGGRLLPPEAITASLDALRAPLGVHLVFGNHDHHADLPTLRALLAASSVHYDDNRVEHLDAGARGGFWLIGLADFLSDAPDLHGTLAQVDNDEPVLAFTHDPDVFPELPARVGLLIAGHTHGGQVNLPLLGRLVVPSVYGERYAAGHIVEQTDLFVATGIGTSHLPVRLGVPPEVALLRLRSPAGAR